MIEADAIANYTFVTVAYRDDHGLLRLQAQSMAMYLAREFVAEIVVIENPRPGQPTDWRDLLLQDYGSLAPKVRFVRARELADIPGKVSGWFSQQILKLMASRIVTTDHYVVLDGKNHLVYPLARNFFETPSGLLRSYLMSYEAHPMKEYLINTLEYFGLDPRHHVGAFMPTTTPFALPTGLVRELVQHVETREQRRFPDAFLYDGYKRSEFFLLCAYILATGRSFEHFYDLSGAKCPTIWPESNAEDCLEAITSSERGACPFFAVHRRAFPTFDGETLLALAAYWVRRGLFNSVEAPLRFLSSPE